MQRSFTSNIHRIPHDCYFACCSSKGAFHWAGTANDGCAGASCKCFGLASLVESCATSSLANLFCTNPFVWRIIIGIRRMRLFRGQIWSTCRSLAAMIAKVPHENSPSAKTSYSHFSRKHPKRSSLIQASVNLSTNEEESPAASASQDASLIPKSRPNEGIHPETTRLNHVFHHLAALKLPKL